MKSAKIFASMFLSVTLLFASTYLVRAFWNTRKEALIGKYDADGAWGRSTLELYSDSSFRQTTEFRNQFNYQPLGTKTVAGTWYLGKRHILSHEVTLSQFVELSPSKDEKVTRGVVLSYGAINLSFGIIIDSGERIVYWKQN